MRGNDNAPYRDDTGALSVVPGSHHWLDREPPPLRDWAAGRDKPVPYDRDWAAGRDKPVPYDRDSAAGRDKPVPYGRDSTMGREKPDEEPS